MIPDYVPAILGLTYITADIVFILAFHRLKSRLRRLDVGIILLVKFKDLLEFYNRGESSLFVKNLIEKAQSSENVSVSQFTNNYPAISGEIAMLHKQFLLPYSLTQMAGSIRNEQAQCLILAVLSAVLLFASYYYSILYVVLLTVLLVNTIFWYPIISAFMSSRDDLASAEHIISNL